jgi:hypothetical protein
LTKFARNCRTSAFRISTFIGILCTRPLLTRKAAILWKLFAAAALLLPGAPGHAQEAQLTDVEIRAAYCLGVATKQDEKNQSDEAKAPAQDDVQHFVYNELEKVLSERRHRLKDYLDVKGVLKGENAKAIGLVLRRGSADAAQCFIDIDEPTYKHCTAQCGQKNLLDEYRKCDARCPPSEACIRVKRCLENFLPF